MSVNRDTGKTKSVGRERSAVSGNMQPTKQDYCAEGRMERYVMGLAMCKAEAGANERARRRRSKVGRQRDTGRKSSMFGC